jgi:gamma-tubulin complex component 3
VSADRDVGLTGQALATGLRDELSEYYRLLSTLEAQVQQQQEDGSLMSLHHLAVWTLQPASRMRLLAQVVDACQGLRGGALVSAVHSFMPHGDQNRYRRNRHKKPNLSYDNLIPLFVTFAVHKPFAPC